MEQQQRSEFQRRLVNANGYAFGAVLLTVGMAIITSSLVWFLISVPIIWIFGILSAAVIGGNVIARRNSLDE